jgi:CRP/FNR family transcriptional regulator
MAIRSVSLDNNPCRSCDVRELTICAALNGHELDRLNAIVSVVQIAPQQTLFCEGEPAHSLFNVTRGTLRVSKMLVDGRRQITGFLGPGDFLGLAFNDTYAYTAEAVTATRLCRFPRTKLEALLEEFPALEKRLLGVASNELAAAQDQMLLLGRKSAAEKVASFLLLLADRAKRQGRPANSVELPMTRTDIADYLGLTMETVSRTFSRFETEGAIRSERAQVVIERPEVLEDLAGR